MLSIGKRVIEVALRTSSAGNVSQILHFHDVTHEMEIDHLKSEFLATAAHELRTPMTSILGFTEILLNEQFDAEKSREMYSIIHRQSMMVSAILNELLDLARIESRRGQDFVFEPIEVQSLVIDVVRSFSLPSGRLAPQLKLPKLPLLVLADSRKARQALMNVLANAFKYSPPGSVVEVEVVEPPEGADGSGRVGICIRDQGIGMTSPQLSRVFERFYRADASGKVLGSGLGMAIVKEIIALHRGEIAIDSRPGVGTSVTLWLPTSVACSRDETARSMMTEERQT